MAAPHLPAAGLPDDRCRLLILKQYAQQLTDVELAQLASSTHGLSGRDLRDVCEMTERRFASKVGRGHALTSHPPASPCPPPGPTRRAMPGRVLVVVWVSGFIPRSPHQQAAPLVTSIPRSHHQQADPLVTSIPHSHHQQADPLVTRIPRPRSHHQQADPWSQASHAHVAITSISPSPSATTLQAGCPPALPSHVCTHTGPALTYAHAHTQIIRGEATLSPLPPLGEYLARAEERKAAMLTGRGVGRGLMPGLQAFSRSGGSGSSVI